MEDKKCYVCQKDTLKKYICKKCYFELKADNERLREYVKKIKSKFITNDNNDVELICSYFDLLDILNNKD